MRSHDYLAVTWVSHDPFILCSYPQYTVYGDSDIARSAQMNTRYSMESLQGIISMFTLSQKVNTSSVPFHQMYVLSLVAMILLSWEHIDRYVEWPMS